MAIFNVESDKIFLQSTGGGEVAVYEIEGLGIDLLQEEHWNSLSTIHFGKRHEYKILKVGDIEIKGRDLTTFLEDLCDSRLMVNREGLCILPTSKIASDEFEVEYYRMFDLFDWSKYKVKSLLTTKWSRNDVLTGRSILAATQPSNHDHEKLEQKLKDFEKESEDRNLKLESVLKELEYQKRKNVSQQKELEDQKHKHQMDLKERRVIGIEEELKKSYTSFAMGLRIPYHTIVVTQNPNMSWGAMAIPGGKLNKARIIDAPLTQYAADTSQVLNIEAVVKDEFDVKNWWLVKILIFDDASFLGKFAFIYYDGDFGYYSMDNSTERMPIPIRNGSTTKLYFSDMYVCHLEGLGLRYGKLIYNG